MRIKIKRIDALNNLLTLRFENTHDRIKLVEALKALRIIH